MNTIKEWSLGERQEIHKILYGKFKEKYPQYLRGYKMPTPMAPLKCRNVDLSDKQMAKVSIPEL
jgi:hypothetical protein